MTRIKICGNTRSEDIKLAIDLGVDFLGLIFAESKRQVNESQAQKLIGEFPAFQNFVGVFVDESKEKIEKIASNLKLRWLQLHGSESAADCHYLTSKGFQVIKTIHVKDSFDVKTIDSYHVPYFLFDTYSKELKGGSGLTFNWEHVPNQVNHGKFFLAGGLTPKNVVSAIRTSEPYAVDVASGVEKTPGIKDPNLLKEFVTAVKYEKKEVRS